MSHLFLVILRDLCRNGSRQDLAHSCSFQAPPPSHSLDGLFLSLPRILCLTQVKVIWKQTEGLKLVFVPRSVFLLLVTLRKVSQRASCKALRWDKVDTIRRVCISQYLMVYSYFFWLNGSITLIRAETERYDIACLSGVTTKLLVWGVKSTLWLYIRELE